MGNPEIAEKKVVAEIKSKPIREQLAYLEAQMDRTKNATERRELLRSIIGLKRISDLEDGKSSNDENLQKKIDAIFSSRKGAELQNSDLLTLKKIGVDIASLTLVYENNPTQDVSSKTMKAGDSFIVNFGKNTSLQNRTGAGDVLPAEVKKIKINGVPCERKNTPRPGYYDEKGKYQVIYDGYKIELLTLGNASKDDTDASERQWRNERLEHMIQNDDLPLTELPEDVELKNQIEEYKKRAQSLNSNFKRGVDTVRATSFRLEDSNFKKVANNVGLDAAYIASIQRIMSAIGEHESNSNYQAVGQILPSGSHKGTAALGRYQIMPKNWVAWSNQYFGEILETTPENQDKIAFARMANYYMKYSREYGNNEEAIFRETAGDWYGRGSAQIAGHPDTGGYQGSVLSIYRAIASKELA